MATLTGFECINKIYKKPLFPFDFMIFYMQFQFPVPSFTTLNFIALITNRPAPDASREKTSRHCPESHHAAKKSTLERELGRINVRAFYYMF